jgi:hypothetical protein
VNTESTAVAIDPEAQIRKGANWLYWVAALSLLNSIAAVTGAQWGFAIGLGVTQLIDGVAGQFESSVATAIGLALDVSALGLVALLGYFARQCRWVYVTAMVLYTFDALVFLLVSDWVSVGFHGMVLFFMLPGFKAFRAQRQSNLALVAQNTDVSPSPVNLSDLQ